MSRRFFFKNEACVEKKQTIKVRNVVFFKNMFEYKNKRLTSSLIFFTDSPFCRERRITMTKIHQQPSKSFINTRSLKIELKGSTAYLSNDTSHFLRKKNTDILDSSFNYFNVFGVNLSYSQ